MSALMDLLEHIREHDRLIGHDKEWEKLRDRIMSQHHTAKSLRELDKDVQAFFQSGAPEDEKISLMGYTESLAILMDAVNNGLLE